MKFFFTNLVYGIVLVLTSLILLGCGERKKEILIVGTSADNPPFEFLKFVKGSPVISGLDIDILNCVMNRLGWKYELKNMDFSALIPSLKSNKIDLVIAAISPTQERKKSINFSRTYYTHKIVMLVNKNQDVKIWGPNWSNKNIGVQTGTSYSTWLYSMKKKKNMKFQIKTLVRLLDMVENLKMGKFDGLIVSELTARAFLKLNPNLNICEIPNAPVIEFAIALRKGSKILKSIDETLLHMSIKNDLKNIINKWSKELN